MIRHKHTKRNMVAKQFRDLCFILANRYQCQSCCISTIRQFSKSTTVTQDKLDTYSDWENISNTQRQKIRLKYERKLRKAKQKAEDNSDLLSEERLSRTSYYAENGMRHVYPYPNTTSYTVNERLQGKSVMEMFTDTKRYQPEKVEHWIRHGSLTVNNEVQPSNYVLKPNDLITKSIHRHERPVINAPIKILASTDDYLVVDKPSSIPVHPSGKYCFNSLLYILAKEEGFANLRNVHRLDRQTSGVLLIGRTVGWTGKTSLLFQKKKVKKTYLCRVEGRFPRERVDCRAPIIENFHLGVQYIGSEGKASHTVFERLGFNGKSSLVKCLPISGRTHQIRLHLQYLGHPIINDNLYNNYGWGPSKGKNAEYGATGLELIQNVRQGEWQKEFSSPTLDRCRHNMTLNDHVPPFDESHMTFDESCDECIREEPHGESSANYYRIYLHALRNEGPFWDFSTEPPYWAADDWDE